MKKFVKSPVFWVVMALLLLLMVTNFARGSSSVAKPTLNEYLAKVNAGEVKTAEVIGDSRVKGVYRENNKKYEVGITPEYSDDIVTKLLESNVQPEITQKPEKSNVWL